MKAMKRAREWEYAWAYPDGVDAFLKEGWEPFAVTHAHPMRNVRIHLRLRALTPTTLMEEA